MDILIKLTHEEGRCVIVVTHDPAISEQADKVYKLCDGKLDGECVRRRILRMLVFEPGQIICPGSFYVRNYLIKILFPLHFS